MLRLSLGDSVLLAIFDVCTTSCALLVLAMLQAVTKEADGTLTLTLKDGESVGGFDQVLLATGREPMLEKLGLENAGVNTDRGYITVSYTWMFPNTG